MICEKCGVPLGISKGNTWYTGGTISGKYPPYIKGTFFDVDEINYLFDELSEYLHYDIQDILAGGKYHDTKEYMDAMIQRLRETSGGELPPPEALYQMMLSPTCIWGIADARIISIEPGKKEVEVKRPYSIPLFCGDVAAVADAVEGTTSKAEWAGYEQEGKITVIPSDAYSDMEERVEKELLTGEEPVEDELACERCGECGAPRAVCEIFTWDAEPCQIIERHTNRRHCFNNTNGIVAVLKLLVSELGDELEQKLIDISREYSRDLYRGLGDAFDFNKELESFPYRGWGAVKEKDSGEGESVVIVENPFSEVLIAGRVWGMEEAYKGYDLQMVKKITEGGSLNLVFYPS